MTPTSPRFGRTWPARLEHAEDDLMEIESALLRVAIRSLRAAYPPKPARVEITEDDAERGGPGHRAARSPTRRHRRRLPLSWFRSSPEMTGCRHQARAMPSDRRACRETVMSFDVNGGFGVNDDMDALDTHTKPDL